MSRKLEIPSKEELIENYTSSISDLGRKFNTSNTTAEKWLKFYNIPRRSHAEASRIANKNNTGKVKINEEAYNQLQDKEWLFQRYVIDKMTAEKIGNLLGVSETPVKEFIDKHQIQRQDHRRKNCIDNNILDNKELLEELYETMSMYAIADLINSSVPTIQRKIAEYNIPVKPSNFWERKHVKISKPVLDLVAEIQSYYPGPIEFNNRKILNGFELDILLPEKNLAIEFNGLFHHCYNENEENFSLRKDARYHLMKTEGCNEKNINLIHIYSDEYYNKKSIVLSMIKSRLGYSNKIYARKCTIEEIDVHVKDQFLLHNHIQGCDKAKVKLGLFYDGKLVSVMTFNTPRFSKDTWELTRFCNLLGYNVVGGFSKLLQHFTKNYCDTNDTIISYADRRYSNGNVYMLSGFQKVAVNRPGFYYVKNGDTRIYRMHLQRKKLLEITGLTEGTEEQLAAIAGYRRIYDCGTLSFRYTYG